MEQIFWICRDQREARAVFEKARRGGNVNKVNPLNRVIDFFDGKRFKFLALSPDLPVYLRGLSASKVILTPAAECELNNVGNGAWRTAVLHQINTLAAKGVQTAVSAQDRGFRYG